MKEQEKVFTPANIVTMTRIVLIPVFVFLLMAPWPTWFPLYGRVAPFKPWVAAFVFALLAATDGVDGYLARSRGEVTTLGKFLDPLADKILVCAALLALCELGKLPSWIALIIVAREFIVSGLRMVASSKGMVIAASWWGKWKTGVTIVALLMFIVKDTQFIRSLGSAFQTTFSVLSWLVMLIAIVLTVISMCDYFAKANRQLHLFTPSKEKRDPASGGTAPLSGGTADALFDMSRMPQPAQIAGQTNQLASEVLERAKGTHTLLACAESCTGGMVASALTDIPGSSEVFYGGIVSYDNTAKITLLDVDAVILKEHGAVSEQTALAMAKGARMRLGTDAAVSTTGIAGPGGGSELKPVGTVWFGLATPDGQHAEKHVLPGDREQVRTQAVYIALSLLLQACR